LLLSPGRGTQLFRPQFFFLPPFQTPPPCQEVDFHFSRHPIPSSNNSTITLFNPRPIPPSITESFSFFDRGFPTIRRSSRIDPVSFSLMILWPAAFSFLGPYPVLSPIPLLFFVFSHPNVLLPFPLVPQGGRYILVYRVFSSSPVFFLLAIGAKNPPPATSPPT